MKIIILTYVLIFSFNALASEQDMFMNLHKAYNSLERFVKGDCKKGQRIAKNYLKMADKALSVLIAENKASEMELPLQLLWELRKNDELSIFDLEGLKAEINYIAKKRKLTSSKEEWNNEVIEECK